MTTNTTTSDQLHALPSGSVTKKIVLGVLSILLVLVISFDSTLIPPILLRGYAWRSTLVFSVLFMGLAWLMFPMRTSRNSWSRVLLGAAVLGGSYVLLLLGESINALVSRLA